MNKKREVAFINESLKEIFFELEKGKFKDKQLFGFINHAIDDLKENPLCGIKISKRLWPIDYIKKYKINNLWKYNLPNSWRLIYTIKEDQITIVSIILEWFRHKDYERRFKY